MNTLHNAVLNENLPRVRQFLNAGANVNRSNENGYTPLHHAATIGRLNILQELLRHRPNVNRRNSLGNTPLHMAVHEEHQNLVRALVAAGANASIRNRSGQTAMNLAKNNVMRNALRTAAVRAPNYSKASATAKKWLNARPHEIRVNQVHVKLPVNAQDPISFKNFNKGNEAIMVMKKNVQGGRIRAKRYYLEKNTLQRLTKKPWRSILRMKASDVVFKDPLNRRAVYRRNLMNVKFT